jgi:hypothetical protein
MVQSVQTVQSQPEADPSSAELQPAPFKPTQIQLLERFELLERLELLL